MFYKHTNLKMNNLLSYGFQSCKITANNVLFVPRSIQTCSQFCDTGIPVGTTCVMYMWAEYIFLFYFFRNTMLSNLDAIHISAVLEDCGDQLAILGHIMPSSLEGRSDASQVQSPTHPFKYRHMVQYCRQHAQFQRVSRSICRIALYFNNLGQKQFPTISYMCNKCCTMYSISVPYL